MGLFKKKEEVKSKYKFYDRDKTKLSKRSIIYIIFMVLIGVCIIFSLSTFLRWHNDISNRKEVLLVSNEDKLGYYDEKNKFIEVTKLVDFYDVEQELSIRDNEAIIAYCGVKKSLRTDCISINPSDSLENAMRNPFNITNLLVVLELLLLFVLLISLPSCSKIVIKLLGGVIILYGLFLIGYQVFNITSYYFFVNDNENVADGLIVKEIKDSSINNKILPVYEYKIEDQTYTYYSMEKTDKGINDTVTLYYGKNKVTERKNPIKVFDLVLGVMIFIIGIMYMAVLPKKVNFEKEIEKINYESNVNA